MFLLDDSYSLVCGKERSDRLHLDFSFLDNKVSAEFILKKTAQGRKDVAHGGILALVLDEAMIRAADARGVKVITTHMSVRFRNSLFIGERAVVQAEIVKPNKRLMEAKALIKGPGSKTIAEGKAKLIIVA